MIKNNYCLVVFILVIFIGIVLSAIGPVSNPSPTGPPPPNSLSSPQSTNKPSGISWTSQPFPSQNQRPGPNPEPNAITQVNSNPPPEILETKKLIINVLNTSRNKRSKLAQGLAGKVVNLVLSKYNGFEKGIVENGNNSGIVGVYYSNNSLRNIAVDIATYLNRLVATKSIKSHKKFGVYYKSNYFIGNNAILIKVASN